MAWDDPKTDGLSSLTGEEYGDMVADQKGHNTRHIPGGSDSLALYFIGDWNSGETYASGDLVIYSGVIYKSLQGSNTNKQPDTETSWWTPQILSDAFYKSSDDTDDLTEGSTNKFLKSGNISGLSEKTAPAGADLLLLLDTADSNNMKKVQKSSIRDKWEPLVKDTDFNDQPASTSTITMVTDQTGNIKVGSAIKFKLSGTYYYAVVTALTSSLMTIAGAPLTTGDGDLTELYYADDAVIQLDVYIPGSFAESASSTLIASIAKSPLQWRDVDAYLVRVQHIVITDDSGATQSGINVSIGGDNVISSNDKVAESWQTTVVDISTSNYSIVHGETIEIAVDDTGSNDDAEDLTVSMTFVRK